MMNQSAMSAIGKMKVVRDGRHSRLIHHHLTPILLSEDVYKRQEWEENHYTLFNHNVNKEGIAI